MQCWYYNCLRWNEEHETKMKCPVARYHPAVRHTWLPWRTNPRTRVSPEKLHTNGIPSRYKAGNFALSKTSWFADTCFIVYFDSCSVTSTPKLSYLHTIPNSQNLGKKKKKKATFLRRSEFSLPWIKGQWDEGGERMLLGDNTAGGQPCLGQSFSSVLQLGFQLDGVRT